MEPGQPARPGGGGQCQGLDQPSGRASLASSGGSSYEPEWSWPWLLGFKGCGRGRERGERSPRPVTLQATPVRAGLGPHSLTPTLFVTLQRISCNIFLPPEIKQSGSNLRLICGRKITSYQLSYHFFTLSSMFNHKQTLNTDYYKTIIL